MRPLEGYRIVELGHFIAGPYAGLVLADLGADVVKVEDPDRVDDARLTGPHFVGGESLYYLALNSAKRSLAVRLTRPRGRQVVLDLARSADVVINNFRPGVMAKLGLEPDTLRELNPRLVTCSLTAYGETGEYASRPGYDYTVQALVGAMSLTGEPGGPPGKAGISYIDHSGGLACALAVCAALLERERTGRGRHVDLALVDTQISMLTYLASWLLNSDAHVERTASGSHQSLVPAQNFPTRDGWVSIFVGNDRQWRQLAAALGDARLLDPEYATNPGRAAHRAVVLALVGEALGTMSTNEATERLVAGGVPCAPVNTVAEALVSRPARDRGLVQEAQHRGYGGYRHVSGPIPGLGGDGSAGAPLLGEHSAEVLAELGYDRETVSTLLADGDVVVDAPTLEGAP